MKLRNRAPWWAWLLLAGVMYATVAAVVFAWRHPELTDTQRFFLLWDAMCWR